MLGYLTDSDFYCFAKGSIYACRGRNKDIKYIFETLQSVVKQVMVVLAQNGKLAVPANPSAIIVDGDIGNTTATATQIVAASFVNNAEIRNALTQRGTSIPPEINSILDSSLSVQELVQRVAAGATEIAGFFKYVSENFPEISRAPVVIEVPEPPKRLTPIGVIVIGVVAVIGVGLLGAAASRAKEPV